MKSVRDLAVCIGYLIDKLKLHPSALIGLGFGGWVAAELATMRPTQFQYLALIGSFGLQPLKGEILDQFLLSHEDYVIKGFYDKKSYPKAYGGKATIEQLVQWDINREMTARIAWKPYMFSQTLSDLLCELDLLTLVAWGREDEIVPLECAHRLIKILPNARLKVYESAGHFLELEKPVALADAIRELNAVR
jgi:pimeloyl-ACP methyl ester carboxylesterase